MILISSLMSRWREIAQYMARAARVAQYQINFFSHFWNHNTLKQLLRVQPIKSSDIFLLVDPPNISDLVSDVMRTRK